MINSDTIRVYSFVFSLILLLCVFPFKGIAQGSQGGHDKDRLKASSCHSCVLFAEASPIYSMLDQRWLLVGAPNLSRPEWGWQLSAGLQYEVKRMTRFSITHHISYLERPWNNIFLVAPVEAEVPLPEVISNVEFIVNAFSGRPFTVENGAKEIFPLHRELVLENRGSYRLLQAKQFQLNVFVGLQTMLRLAPHDEWSPAELGDDIGSRFGFDEVIIRDGKRFIYRTPEFARIGLGISSGLVCSRKINNKSSISLSSSYNRQLKSMYKQNVAGPIDRREGQPVWHDFRMSIGYQMTLGNRD